MSSGKKLLIFVVLVLVLGGVVAVSLNQQGRNRVSVQTGTALRQNIAAVVTAAGEITPKTYADISPTTLGQITNLYVKEGEHVTKGELLAKLWNVQQAAQVNGMTASLKTSRANLAAQEAALGTAQANIASNQAQLAQQTQNWRRTQALFEDKLLARSDYDTAEASYKTAVAQLQVSQAALKQAQAQVNSLKAQIGQAQANLVAAQDVLSLTQFRSPLTGIVTYLPVHVGDTVVMGIENSPGSVIMRVADMSVVTADVMVDETDIANVAVGQPVSITIDAFGDQIFPARVTEVGDTAILRSTGAAATSTTGSDAQQAKDFKVVVQLNDPPADMRPGLSCTANITTATAQNAITIPLQAVVEREPGQLKPPAPNAPPAAVAAAAAPQQNPIQGVFVLQPDLTAKFVAVATGVTGVDRVQVLRGIQAGDEIVTGPYTALRTLANNAKIKVDNTLLAASQAAGSNP
ncbi:MAG: efflux RND transporter periplasmic adaptor subunit [Terriglobales bacterium]